MRTNYIENTQVKLLLNLQQQGNSVALTGLLVHKDTKNRTISQNQTATLDNPRIPPVQQSIPRQSNERTGHSGENGRY